MHQQYLHDQRGVAMLLELVLVAAVLGLVGLAVYQSNHKPNPTASVTTQPTIANKAAGVADAAAAITETSAATDASLSASADASASQVTDSDVDVSNLGGSTSASSY